MTTPQPASPPPKSTHLQYLRQTIELAQKSPPKPTNFRVGCVIVSYPHPTTSTPSEPTTSPQSSTSTNQAAEEEKVEGRVLSTGFTLELPGNTHAEQCALAKLTTDPILSLSQTTPNTSDVLTREANATLYTSLEPCGLRLSGNTACVQRIIATRDGAGGGIRRVVFGAKEPGTFVRDSKSCRILSEARVEWEYIGDLEGEILAVAMEGHVKGDGKGGDKRQEEKKTVTNVDDISEEERRRQEAQPRNPKKRMMELQPDPRT